MRPLILNLGLPATHARIVGLGAFTDPISISDYDALCFDPDSFAQQVMRLSRQIGPVLFQAQLGEHGHEVKEAILRRQREVSELLVRKGGLVLCVLQPSGVVFNAQGAGGNLPFGKYAFVTGINAELDSAVARIEAGTGQSMRILEAQRGVAHAYLQILKGHLSFHAHFQPWADKAEGRIILAENSAGNPVAVEFDRGAGKVCFVPAAVNVPGDRLGAAIVQTFDRFFAGEADIPEPEWAVAVAVPGVADYDPKISALENKLDVIVREMQTLESERQKLLNYKKLLFGYGKAVLEPVVRASFREFGLRVPEPDEYSEDWDAYLTHPDGRTAIAEVEGTEGIVDVWKHRQLLEYVETEAQEGRTHKGILVGNGFRLAPLDSPERNNQFSEHVIRGAQRNGFCLLPTTELFKAVCAVLEDAQNLELKKSICDSLFSVVGTWVFTR